MKFWKSLPQTARLDSARRGWRPIPAIFKIYFFRFLIQKRNPLLFVFLFLFCHSRLPSLFPPAGGPNLIGNPVFIVLYSGFPPAREWQKKSACCRRKRLGTWSGHGFRFLIKRARVRAELQFSGLPAIAPPRRSLGEAGGLGKLTASFGGNKHFLNNKRQLRQSINILLSSN